MSTNLILFDDLGTTWSGGSQRLRKSFGSMASNEEFSTYVVKNMGFIAVHSYGLSCEIRLRPALVTPVCFRALCEWMSGRSFERIVMAYHDKDWKYGLYAGKDAAIAKVDALLQQSKTVRPSDFLMRTLRKDELPRTTEMHRSLHKLIEQWPVLSQTVKQGGLPELIKQSLQGRYTVVNSRANGRDLIFREIGTGFASYTDEWVSRSQGACVDELDDAAYGRWAASGYRQALLTGLPAISQVDAIINTPRMGRARIRYSRVLLPARMLSGAVLLTSSILDPTIDLRVDLLDKTA